MSGMMLQALLVACLLLPGPAIHSQSEVPSATVPAPAAAAASPLGQIKHVVIVLEENTDFSSSTGSNMPYLSGLLAQQGGLATNYYANTHPSIGNYFMLTTGQILTNDDSRNPQNFPVSVDNIVRELLAAGLTWKAYCEDLPSVGYTGGNTGNYAVRHCPLTYMTDVQNDNIQRQKLVPFTQFPQDLASNNLPNFSFITPNLCNDAHNCSIRTADTWLQNNINPLVKSPTFNQDTLLIVVMDEAHSDNTHGGGRIEWGIVGATVKPGYQSTTTSCGGTGCFYQHESTLRLILKTLGVNSFPGAAATAPDMNEFFNSGPPPPGPAVSLSSTSLTFASQPVGTTSSPQSVTLTSTGSAALSLSTIAVTGTNSTDYAETNNCGSSVNAAANCTINVSFTPLAGGSRSATLQITDNAPGSPHTVSLTGTGAVPAVSLSPLSLDFGSQPQGTSSSPSTVTLTNSGNASLTMSSNGIAVNGANAADFTLSNTSTCSGGGTVAAGSSCSIKVVFKPSTTGSESATLTLTDNAPNSPQSVPLSGTGTAPAPILGLNPAAVSFGNQPKGTASAAQLVTLSNTGNGTLNISGISTIGTNAADFALAGSSNCPVAGGTLAAAASCRLDVTFTPSTTAAESAKINIVDNAAGSPQTVSLSGTGTASAVSLAPAALAFSGQLVGTMSSAQAVTLTNHGNGTLSISGITISGSNSGDFAQTNTCGSSVNAGGNCSINITFKPSANGARSATLNVSDNAAGSPQTVTLSGTGTSPGVQLSPPSLTFGSQTVGTTSASQAVTLTNNATGTLTINSMTFTGANSGDFSKTDNCGASVNAGASCTINVSFKPAASGARSASLSISDNAAGSPHSVTLSGTGVAAAPGLSVHPANLAFGNVNVGSRASQNVTLTNTGNASLTISQTSVTGSGFSRTGLTTPLNLAAGQSASFSVNFAPTAAGGVSGNVTLTSNAPNSPATIPLSGMGTTAGVQLTPGSLMFGSQAVGSTSPAQAVTLTSSGTASLTISSVQITGANAGDFALASGTTCTNGSSVSAGASCTINVTLKPSALGSRSATISIADSAAGSPHTVSLTGTGGGASLILTPAAGTRTVQTVNAGGTAKYNLQIAAPSDFSGQVSLSCSGAPAQATCSVSPASLALNGTAPGAFAVTVVTKPRRLGSGQIAPPAPTLPSRPVHGQERLLALLAAGAMVVLLLPKACRPRKLELAAPAAVLLLLGVLLAGCSGLTSSTPIGTPAGNYTLTINATSAGGSGSMNLTLTVK